MAKVVLSWSVCTYEGEVINGVGGVLEILVLRYIFKKHLPTS